MNATIKRVEAWPFTFGGQEHQGWLPPGAAVPLPTPLEHELLDIRIDRIDGGYLLIWSTRSSPTCRELRPPKIGDTWHETAEEAEQAACSHFGVGPEHWIVVDE